MYPEKRDAIIRQVGIVGEATSKLSRAFRITYPAIPWAQIIGPILGHWVRSPCLGARRVPTHVHREPLLGHAIDERDHEHSQVASHVP